MNRPVHPAICHADLRRQLRRAGLPALAQNLGGMVAQGLDCRRHGDLPLWYAALDAVPPLASDALGLDCDAVRIGRHDELDERGRAQLERALMAMAPWRKGPFCLFGLHLDAEWRSQMKWRRLAAHLRPLGRVLDVGCGNGYYLLRMIGAGADLALGLDPSPRALVQFYQLRRLAAPVNAHILPCRLEQCAEMAAQRFDSLFSMGVLSHSREPQTHLQQLRRWLAPGGQLILETLVIEGGDGDVLRPKGRYARMGNVHLLPSVPTLVQWVQDSGFKEPLVLDINRTNASEQRRTRWMRYHSLADFLDPQNPALTREGHPAPRRALLMATG